MYAYFEAVYGTATADGGYMYDCPDYGVFATANLLIGFLLPNGSDPDWLQRLFQGPPPFVVAHQQPQLTGVDYPAVMVPSAYFNASRCALSFSLISGA